MIERTILVVDDEQEIRAVLRTGLEQEGWSVVEAWDRASLFDGLASHDVDLITLDVVLGGDDGLKLASELRQIRNVPIIMISGKVEPDDRVRGLEHGADDYVTKPFLVREVVLRARHLFDIYHAELAADSTLLFDHSIFDQRHRAAHHLDGTPIELTEIEMRLLVLFLRHPGRILSRDEISRALYNRDWSPYDRTIDGHVARLRRKIEPLNERPTLIRTVRGIGYVFSGDVKIVDQND